MFRSFIQMTALILTFAGSYYLLRVNLGFSPDTIAKTSMLNHTGFNEEIANILSKEYVYTYIGFILLILSLFLQIIYLLLPMTIADLGGLNHWGIFLSFGFCAIFLILLNWYSKKLFHKYFIESMEIIRKKLNKYMAK